LSTQTEEIEKPEDYDKIVVHHREHFGTNLEDMDSEELHAYYMDFAECWNTNGNNPTVFDLFHVVEYLRSL
jgi:hypothetical protein